MLYDYAIKKFSDQYKFSYGGTPPDLTKETDTPYIKSNKHLLYLQGIDSRLNTLVNNELIT